MDLQIEHLEALEAPELSTGQTVGVALIALGAGIIVGAIIT